MDGDQSPQCLSVTIPISSNSKKIIDISRERRSSVMNYVGLKGAENAFMPIRQSLLTTLFVQAHLVEERAIALDGEGPLCASNHGHRYMHDTMHTIHRRQLNQSVDACEQTPAQP